MISLKAAVVGVSVVGAVAAGGISWATIGQPDAVPVGAKEKVTGAVQEAKPQVPEGLPNAPAPKDVQKVQPKVPAEAPQAPALPDLKDLNCTSAPAITVGGVLEREVLLSQGVHGTATKVVPRRIGTQTVCATVQRYVPKVATGAYITVERIVTPVGTVTESALRQSLQLPDKALQRANIGGAVVITSVGQGGALVLDPAGYAVYVNGSPVYAPSVQKIATAVAKEAATRR